MPTSMHASPSQGSDPDRMVPWSHRQPKWVRVLIDMLAGVGSGIVGTLAHRMGASINIPYGLVLAFVLLGMSAWCARSRDGGIGLAWHLIASSAVVCVMSMRGPLGDAMVPLGFSGSGTLPFFSRYAGIIWVLGMVIEQVVICMLPSSWFRMEPGRRDMSDD